MLFGIPFEWRKLRRRNNDSGLGPIVNCNTFDVQLAHVFALCGGCTPIGTVCGRVCARAMVRARMCLCAAEYLRA
jgi:hypothetical protein